MKPDIKLDITGPGQHQLVIREDNALKVHEPIQIELSGILDSPLRWLEKKLSLINQTITHILVDRNSLKITLDVHEKDDFGEVIHGKLELHPMFKKFAINTDTYLSNFEMAKLFKMNRSAFEVQSTAMHLVSELNNFKAKVAKEIEKSTDNRGNATDLRSQIVNSNLPDSFNLFVPIFKGTEPRLIEVEVYIKPDDLSCTLVSPQANDLVEEMRDGEMNRILDQIRELAPAIAIIEQ